MGFHRLPLALGSLSLQPHIPLPRLVLFSRLHSFVLLRTHVHNRLDLRVSRLPSKSLPLGIIGILSDCFAGFNFEGAGGRSQVGGGFLVYCRPARYVVICRFGIGLRFWPHFRLRPGFFGFHLIWSGFGYPGWRVANRIKSKSRV